MNTKEYYKMVEIQEEPRCDECPLRRKAEARPKSLLARLWRWHTSWCPGWKAYQEKLNSQDA
jgi:adenine-specific DNA glycosylase